MLAGRINQKQTGTVESVHRDTNQVTVRFSDGSPKLVSVDHDFNVGDLVVFTNGKLFKHGINS